jgi:Ser/Thr protein kinase RdoA (MazF antagonist)
LLVAVAVFYDVEVDNDVLTQRVPSEHDAVALVRQHLGRAVRAVRRFPTGLANYVYDVLTDDDRAVVVRMSPPGRGAHFAAAVYWYRQLVPRGVPLPRLFHYAAEPGPDIFPFMMIERLPGRDLGLEYPHLSAEQKRDLAGRMATIQRGVGGLPPGPGFGYARSYDDRGLHPTWLAVLRAALERSRKRMGQIGVVDPGLADRVAAKLPAYAHYFAAVEPRPFLDDTTTKNVLVHEGRLTGIVDVDCVCFGDPLLTPALTQVALLSGGHDIDYVRYWVAELQLGAEQQAVLALYVALFCVDFLSEIGQQFNQGTPAPVDPARVARLVGLLDTFLRQV